MKPATIVAFIGLLLTAYSAPAQAPEPPIAGASRAAIGTDEPARLPEMPASVEPSPARRPAFVPFDDKPWPAAPIPAYPTTPRPRASIGYDIVPVQAEVVEPAQPGYLPAPLAPRPTGLLPRLVETIKELDEEPTALQDGRPVPGELLKEPLELTPEQPAQPMPIAEMAPAPYWPRFWTDLEFLLWLMPRGPARIPLVTTGPSANTVPGALDDPDTVVLLGPDELKYGNYQGARVTMGCWLTRSEIIGVEFNAFYVGADSIDLTFPSSLAESGVIARPFFNAVNGTGGSAAVSFPNILAGSLNIDSDSRLYGGELNLIGKFVRREHWDMDVIGGYRYLELKEDLEFSNATTTLQDGVVSFLDNPLPTNTTVDFYDRFATKNRFQGGQFGLRTNHRLGNLTVSMLGKVALGMTRETVQIAGRTTSTPPNSGSSTYPAGVFALDSNSGTFVRDEFSVVPQFQVTFAYQCRDWLRVFFNYDFLWWSRVLRPGDQIDPYLNPQAIPTTPLGFNPAATPIRPLVPFMPTSFWAQGIGLGAEFKY